jgi:hypothetical protein
MDVLLTATAVLFGSKEVHRLQHLQGMKATVLSKENLLTSLLNISQIIERRKHYGSKMY